MTAHDFFLEIDDSPTHGVIALDSAAYTKERSWELLKNDDRLRSLFSNVRLALV